LGAWIEHTRGPLVAAGALLALVACGGRGADKTSPATPVVLVSFDTLRADRLGCYGYERRSLTPHIDALAGDGIVFLDHISAAPWTIPAHISLLTSLWPGSHGVTGSLRELREDESDYHVLSESRTTLAELLQARGWATGAFTAGDTLDPRFGYGQGFETYDTSMLKLREESVRAMLDWVKQRRDRPFFLFWHTFEAHAPYLGTRFLEDVLAVERAAEVREAVTRYGDKLRRGEAQAGRFEHVLERRDAFTPEVTEALYEGAIADADEWLGRVVEELRSLGLYDRSLVIFTSDHGEEFRDRSNDAFYNAHGHDLFREMVRVPLIVKLPGGAAAGTRVSGTSRGVDVMPTILDVVRVAGTPEMQGVSLRPLWETVDAAPRAAFVEALESQGEAKAIQAGRYKYIVRMGSEEVLREGRGHIPPAPEWRGLFDLRDDPGERRNLVEGEMPEATRQEADRLDRALREHVLAQHPDSRPASLDPEMIERLRTLGYVQ